MTREQSARQLWEPWVREHYAMVFRIGRRVCGNVADAEDVAQQVFLTLLEQTRGGHESAPASMRAWLATVALNASRKHIRGESNRRNRQGAWVQEKERAWRMRGSSADGYREEHRADLERCLGQLSEELRMPLVLHYQEGLKYREIAEVLQCPEGTVARRISTAKERLRRLAPKSLGSAGSASLGAFVDIESILQSCPPEPVPEAVADRIVDQLDRIWSSGSTSAAGTTPRESVTPPSTVVSSTKMKGKSMVLKSAVSVVMLLGGVWVASTLIPPSGSGKVGDVEDRSSGLRSIAAVRGSVNAGDDRDTSDLSVPSAEVDPKPDPGLSSGSTADAAVSRRLYGWIRDDSGDPVVDAHVEVRSRDESVIGTTRSDSQGYYEFMEAEGWGVVERDSGIDDFSQLSQMRPPPVKMTEEGVRIGAQRRAVEVLEGASEEAERVTPLPRSVVWGGRSSVQTSQQMEASNGIHVHSWRVGFSRATKTLWNYSGDEARQADLVLQVASPLEGRVVDALGRAVSGARVEIAARAGDSWELPHAEVAIVESNADGEFHFEHIVTGRYLVQVNAAGHSRLLQTVELPRDEPLELELAAGATLEVVLTHRELELPIEGATVDLSNDGGFLQRAQSNAEGLVTFADVIPGSYQWVVRRGELKLRVSPVDLTAGIRREHAQLDDGITLKGLYLGEERVLKQVVLVRWVDGQEVDRISTMIDGPAARSKMSRNTTAPPPEVEYRYSIFGLVPGRYLVNCCSLSKGNRSDLYCEKIIDIDGSRKEVELDLERQQWDLARFDLRVFVENSVPCEGGVVRLMRQPIVTGYHHQTLDADAHFQHSAVPGDYSLLVTCKGYQPHTVRVTLKPGERYVADIHLDPAPPQEKVIPELLSYSVRADTTLQGVLELALQEEVALAEGVAQILAGVRYYASYGRSTLPELSGYMDRAQLRFERDLAGRLQIVHATE